MQVNAGNGRRSLTRIVMSGLAALMLLPAAQAASGAVASAKAASCEPHPGEGWYCTWGFNLPPETRGYLELAEPVRNWEWGKIADGYGGTAAAKCLNAQRYAYGTIAHVACGSGEPTGSVPAGENPSYMFLVQSANGYRVVAGLAVSPYPI